MHKIYITGIAGFIGFHTAKKLSIEGYAVYGMDNFNDYYDSKLKRDRANILKDEYDINIETRDIQHLNKYSLSLSYDYDAVIHLAAYAGVRDSLDNTQTYIDTNITGTQKLIKVCEEFEIPVVYASSSSVSPGILHAEDYPIFEHHTNPYAWSKYVNECQFAHSKLLSAGLRFFTVYGPYGRPDMALNLFANNISQGKEINVYNNGDMQRDFTYVDDIVQGIQLVLENILTQPQENKHEIYNIGSGKKNELIDYIECLENELGRVALKNYLPMHPADAKATCADITKIQKLGYQPTTTIEDGIKQFTVWFKEYYKDMYF